MSTSDKSLSKKKARPLRKLVSLAVLAGIAVAIKNALEDKGGSYEAPAPQSSAEPVPTPPVPQATVVTAEEVVRRPVENLDEFADPVEPVPEPEAEAVPEFDGEEPEFDEAAPEADEEEPEAETPTRVEDAITAEQADDSDEIRSVSGKIDPFGIR